jgi:hypothetical protein
MSTICQTREFTSFSEHKASDRGRYNASTRVSSDGRFVIIQFHGLKEDPNSVDTAFMNCFHPIEAAKLYCRLGDALTDQGFDIKEFEDNWIEKQFAKTSSEVKDDQ